MIKRNAQLLVGLHQPEHDVASDATVAANGSAGDLAPGYEGANIVLRRIDVQGNVRIFENLEQFLLAPMVSVSRS